MQYVKGML